MCFKFFFFAAMVESADPGLTTHVLYTSTGRPGENVAINVYYQCNSIINDDDWMFLKEE